MLGEGVKNVKQPSTWNSHLPTTVFWPVTVWKASSSVSSPPELAELLYSGLCPSSPPPPSALMTGAQQREDIWNEPSRLEELQTWEDAEVNSNHTVSEKQKSKVQMQPDVIKLSALYPRQIMSYRNEKRLAQRHCVVFVESDFVTCGSETSQLSSGWYFECLDFTPTAILFLFVAHKY